MDPSGLLDGAPAIPKIDGHRDPMDLDVGRAEHGPEIVAIPAKPLRHRRGFGEELVGSHTVPSLGRGDGTRIAERAVDGEMRGRRGAESRLETQQRSRGHFQCLLVSTHGEKGMRQHPSTGRDHRSEEHTAELQSRGHLVCRLLLEKKKKQLIILLNYKKKKKAKINNK